jgi:hypothetical protein
MNEIFHPIKILIITEKGREEYWTKKFIQIFKKINIKKQRDMYILQNDFILIYIKFSFNEASRGMAYSFCIIDTKVKYEILTEIIYPSLKQRYTITHNGKIDYNYEIK